MRVSRLHGAGVLVTAALVLTGCGGSEPDIAVTTTEYQFAPASWSATAGEEFSIELTNDGSVEHEWAVVKLGEDIASGDEFEEDRVLLEVEAVPAGEGATESFTIEEAGTYQVICALVGHFDEGMEGTLTVE